MDIWYFKTGEPQEYKIPKCAHGVLQEYVNIRIQKLKALDPRPY